MYQNINSNYAPSKAANRVAFAGLSGLAMLVAIACGRHDAAKNPSEYTPSTQEQTAEKPNTPKQPLETTLVTWVGYVNGKEIENLTEGTLIGSSEPGVKILIPSKHMTHVKNSNGNTIIYTRDERTFYGKQVEDEWEKSFAGLQRITIVGPDNRTILAHYHLKVDSGEFNPKSGSFEPKAGFVYRAYTKANKGRDEVFDQNSATASVKGELDRLVGEYRGIWDVLDVELEGPIRTDKPIYELPLDPPQREIPLTPPKRIPRDPGIPPISGQTIRV